MSDSRDFRRIVVEEKLQVDFVNDRVHRNGGSEYSPEGYRLDNLASILSNKICAVTGRDEAKDAFDLWAILTYADVDPAMAFAEARKKCEFTLELLEFRLREFPLRLLDDLAVAGEQVLRDARSGYLAAVEKLLSAVQ